jgi:NAD(P)-dependent dehydrogenase (short-subunit alcohol dehydrogenase family)
VSWGAPAPRHSSTASDAIRINSVCPGWLATPMVTERPSALLGRDLLETAASQIPMGRVGDPAEVAKLVVWLASSDNWYLTRQGIVIDGGYTAA